MQWLRDICNETVIKLKLKNIYGGQYGGRVFILFWIF